MNSLRRGVLLILLILLSGVVASLTLSSSSVYAENFSGWAGGCTSGSNCVSGTSNGFMCNYATCGDPVSGSGDGQFNLPRGVAVDDAGNVYVTDAQNDRVENFSGGVFVGWAGACTSGSHCTNSASDGFTCTYATCGASYGDFGDGQFNQPDAIAIDSAGDLYIADSSNSRVELFSSSGLFEGWAGGCTSGSHCSSGESDGFTCTYATCGAPVAGSGDGQFNSEAYSVAVDSSGNNVYVTDFYSNRVEKFSGGSFLGWAGECTGGSNCDTTEGVDHSIGFTCTAATCTGLAPGSGDGQFDEPMGVAVDRSGNVYVTDWSNNRVEKFDSSGNFLLAWGSYGNGDGEFNYPYGVAVDSSGNNVYVVDQYNHRVQLFSSSGVFEGWAGKCESVSGSNCNTAGLTVQEYYSVGFTCTTATCGTTGVSNYGSTDGQFYYPWGVAVDSTGNVYVADADNNRVQLFAAPPPPPQGLITEVGSGQGSVDPDCPGPAGCSETVGSAISVTATAASGYVFSSWSLTGASCSNGSTSNPCTFSMPDNPVTVSATFTIAVTSSQVNVGTLSGFTAAPLSSVSTPPPAVAGTFPAGVFSFTVSGLSVGGTATVTITLSSPLPPGGFSYWKFHGGVWLQLPASKATLDSTRTVITLTLTDGATPDDSDGVANGVIVDPGGPAIYAPCTSVSGYAGSFNYCKMNLVQGWNLISLLVVPNSTAITAAQLKYPAYSLFFVGAANSVNNMFNKTGLGLITSVYTYNGKTWLFCTVKSGSCGGTLTTMVDGSGYWVFTTSNTVVLSFGGWIIQPGSPPPAYTLVNGWNLVGFKPQPVVQSETVAQYLTSISGSYDQNNVWVYDNTSGSWMQGTSTTLSPGEAMWILVTSPSGATLTP